MHTLIQSAALCNAAIARSPNNVDAIKYDIKQNCKQLLELANVKNLNANLITASKQFKQEIEKMRLKVKNSSDSFLRNCGNITKKFIHALYCRP